MGLVAIPVLLSALLSQVEDAHLVRGNASTEVRGIAFDSRRVSPGDVFVAISGLERDGRDFVPDAIRRGAVAVAAEAQVDTHLPLVLVDNARLALADFAA